MAPLSSKAKRCFVQSQVMEVELLLSFCQGATFFLGLTLHSLAAFTYSALHFPMIPSSFSTFYDSHLHFLCENVLN